VAFELIRELTSGVVGNYWKISSALVACTDNPIVGINLELYLTRDARLEGKSSILNENITLSIYDIDMSYSFDFRACLYAALRNISPWSSAVDVFDDPNKLPVIADASILTSFNTAKTISLNSWDPFNLPLTYSVVEQPTNGLIFLNDKECTYTPNVGFYGIDSAKFKTNNGEFDSSIANINIQVEDTNERPMSFDSSISTSFNTAKTISLNSWDPFNLPLVYSIVEQPTNGSIVLNDKQCTYTPNNGFYGIDSAKFKTNNGEFDSSIANINIQVEDTNERPISFDSSLSLDMDNDCLINFNANDPNNLPLSYIITEGPFNGSILVNNDIYTYRPNLSFSGSDYIIYKSSNGNFESMSARIDFNIAPGEIIE
jgi:hypothetical protein